VLAWKREADAGLYRLNAHALIELGRIDQALGVLTLLRANLKPGDPEYSQAIGLMGRAYKQVFLDNQDSSSLFARAALISAVALYQEGFMLAQAPDADKRDLVWLGVNVAALGCRAGIEKIELPGIDWRRAADTVVSYIEEPGHPDRATAWNFASAGEASLALGDAHKAITWFERYAQANDPNANALHSIVRQLQQLWKIKADLSPVGKIFAMLQARVLGVEKGELKLTSAEIAALPSPDEQNRDELERVIGQGGIVIYTSFVNGLTRGSKTIARIGRSKDKGVGTGFLVNGEDFCPAWRGKRVLLTNAHVVTNDRGIPNHDLALLPQEAVVSFTASGDATQFTVKQLLWTSPCHEYDATFLELTPPPPDGIFHCEIAPVLPPRAVPAAEKSQLFIMGHPGGGELSVSLNNNELVDHEGPADGAVPPPRVRIHYRTPTERGNSGSPVFYGDNWQVIGIHHKAVFEPLTPVAGPYEANEAIWIQSIRQQTLKLGGTSKPAGKGFLRRRT
jgi:Trypsin-like peptidase domain